MMTKVGGSCPTTAPTSSQAAVAAAVSLAQTQIQMEGSLGEGEKGSVVDCINYSPSYSLPVRIPLIENIDDQCVKT